MHILLLRRLNLLPVKNRRTSWVIIEMYKIVKGHEGIEWVKPPRLRPDLELEGPTKRVSGKILEI